MKITIHRALAELKTLGARIEKAIVDMKLLGTSQKDKDVIVPGENGRSSIHVSSNVFNEKVKADYQSVVALIERRSKIKEAIVASNATTKVKIGAPGKEKEMTVAEAITERAYMAEKKKLLAKMQQVHTVVQGAVNKLNEEVATKLQKNLEVMLGSDKTNRDAKQVEELTKSYNDLNQWSLVDPLGIEEKTKVLSDEISEFETNVDAALSESNAVTFIEVAD